MTYHLIDSFHNCQHLLVADLSITINVVQLESPIQLVLHLAAGGDGQSADEFLKVDRAGLVAVKDVEDVVCERGRVAEGEELPVNLLELLLGEHTRRAILQESYPAKTVSVSEGGGGAGVLTLVPLLQLLLVEVGGSLELIELVLGELGLAVITLVSLVFSPKVYFVTILVQLGKLKFRKSSGLSQKLFWRREHHLSGFSGSASLGSVRYLGFSKTKISHEKKSNLRSKAFHFLCLAQRPTTTALEAW